VQRGLPGEQVRQRVGVEVGQLENIKIMSQALLELIGRCERSLHRHLLIKEHRQKQRQGVTLQQRISRWLLAQHQAHQRPPRQDWLHP
jgi:hypothetical protein